MVYTTVVVLVVLDMVAFTRLRTRFVNLVVLDDTWTKPVKQVLILLLLVTCVKHVKKGDSNL